MAKLKASQVAEKVASQAVEWMGGIGFTKVSTRATKHQHRPSAGSDVCGSSCLCARLHPTHRRRTCLLVPLLSLLFSIPCALGAGVSQREVLPRLQDRLHLRGNHQPPAADHRKGNQQAVPVKRKREMNNEEGEAIPRPPPASHFIQRAPLCCCPPAVQTFGLTHKLQIRIF